MCLEVEDLMQMNFTNYEIRTNLEHSLNMKSLNEVKLLTSLFDYATSYSKRQLIRIVTREIIYLYSTANQYIAAQQPPPRRRINVIFEIDGNDSVPPAEEVCPICIDSFRQNYVISTNCNHKICTGCVCQYITRNGHQGEIICPLCRSPIDKLYANSQDSYQQITRLF